MQLVALKDITTGERFRKEYGDLDELVESFRRFGVLQPIVLDRQMNLIAGGRRLAAATKLGLDQIPASFRDEVDELTSREIELEENIRRKDLTWQERAFLTAEIDRLKREKYGSATGMAGPGSDGWSLRDTAQAIDRSLGMVSMDLAAARLLEVMPELAEESSLMDARKRAEQTLEALEREQALRASRPKHDEDTIWLGDCRELIKKVPDSSVDCLLIDPPYGTDAKVSKRDLDLTGVHFDDTPETAFRVLRDLMPEYQRVLKPNAHIYCFFGIKVWMETFTLFREFFGDGVDPIPIVWWKNTEGHVDFSKRYVHMWEPILFVSRNWERSLSQKGPNVFQVPAPTDRANIAEKPEALLAEFISRSTVEGEIVMDTFSGSGATACTAKRLNRRFVAMEEERDQWTRSLLRLKETPIG